MPLVYDVYDAVPDHLREELIALWRTVADDGAAVGLREGATYEQAVELLAMHEGEMADGRSWLVTLSDDGRLIGIAWWAIGHGDRPRHVATIKRLLIDPARQGQGLGTAMMNYLHTPEVLARLEGVDFLHLQFRTGDRLGAYYARWGYELIARFDMWRKNDDGSYGGWAEMARFIDRPGLTPFDEADAAGHAGEDRWSRSKG